MKLPPSSYNWLTVTGAFISSFSFLIIVLLFIISEIFKTGSTYLGLFLYIIIPGFMLIGLILIPVGMLIKKERIKMQKFLLHEGFFL
jgi:hypothetical protein